MYRADRTEFHGSVDSTLTVYSGGFVYKSWPGAAYPVQKFSRFFYSLQTNVRTLAQCSTWLLPFSSFPIDYQLITLPFIAVCVLVLSH